MPSQEKWNPLTKSDAAHITLWSGPCNKEFSITEALAPDFSLTSKITRKLYLATDAPEGKEILNILQDMLKTYSVSNDPVTIVPSKQDVSIVLDTPDYFEWKPLCATPKATPYGLNLAFRLNPRPSKNFFI